jgi:hypothetical protein
MDACPRSAMPPAPMGRDTRAPGGLPLSRAQPWKAIPERGPPEAHMFDLELGNPLMVPWYGALTSGLAWSGVTPVYRC